jgi:hypothetical protein
MSKKAPWRGIMKNKAEKNTSTRLLRSQEWFTFSYPQIRYGNNGNAIELNASSCQIHMRES